MISKKLRNWAAGLLLFCSTGSVGIGVADAVQPSMCPVSISAPQTQPSAQFPSTEDGPACRYEIEGKAQDWVWSGMSGIGAVAGISLFLPIAGGAPPSRGRAGAARNAAKARTREGDMEADDAASNYEQ